jgi:ABC-type sulfate/molybdate transport systems ATPase subunit
VQQFGAPDEVSARPTSPFVYHFLGDVNLFHGRVRGARAWIGDLAVDVEHATASTMSRPSYACPHEIAVDRHPNGGGIKVVVRDVRPFGDVVRIELERRNGTGQALARALWRIAARQGRARLSQAAQSAGVSRSPRVDSAGPVTAGGWRGSERFVMCTPPGYPD